MNGVQGNTDSETDKTADDDDDDNNDDNNGIDKTSARRDRKTTANRNNRDAAAADDDDDEDDDDDSENDDLITVSEPVRPAKVIAGEVIKQWSTKTRSKGCVHHHAAVFVCFLKFYCNFDLSFFHN